MAEQVAVEKESAGLSQITRVVDTFIAPHETFADIRRSSSWWLPFVLLSLATLGVTFAIDQQVGFQQVAETQVQMNPSQAEQLAALTPEARAERMHTVAQWYRYIAYAYPVVLLAISAFAALVLWVSFNFGLGARATYGQILCLWMYCELPRLLAALVTVVRLYFGDGAENFDLKEPIGTNIGYYLPDAAAWVRTLLGFVDVMGLWVLALLVIGGAIVAKVKLGQAAAVIIGWWLLIVVASTAATAAFS